MRVPNIGLQNVFENNFQHHVKNFLATHGDDRCRSGPHTRAPDLTLLDFLFLTFWLHKSCKIIFPCCIYRLFSIFLLVNTCSMINLSSKTALLIESPMQLFTRGVSRILQRLTIYKLPWSAKFPCNFHTLLHSFYSSDTFSWLQMHSIKLCSRWFFLVVCSSLLFPSPHRVHMFADRMVYFVCLL